MWDVAGWLLLLMGGVLCVERCGGMRRACAVRVCVLERACVCGAVREGKRILAGRTTLTKT